MRFSLVHKLASYLMVLAAVASLWFSPEVSVTAKLLSLAAIIISWFVNPGRLSMERWTSFWNMATLAFFAYLIIDVLHEAPVINAGIHFLLFVLVNKLFNRITSKDYRQAYVVSFLVLVAATTINTDISYAVCFALYVIFTVWALTLFHLRREMEENYLLRHGAGGQSEKVEVERILNSRRIVGVPFLVSTSMVALGVLISSVLVFVAFPRVGFGLFLGVRRGGVTMVGFEDRVELGQHGTIRDNPQVVMRITFPKGRPSKALYWRGSVYDHYEDGVWSQGKDVAGKSRPLRRDDGMYRVTAWAPGQDRTKKYDSAYIKENLLEQRIYLEPLDSTIIFAADRPMALDVGRTAVGYRRYFRPASALGGEIRALNRGQSGVIYSAWSLPPALSDAHLAKARPEQDPKLDWYLQTPPNMPARVKNLALRITRGKVTVHEKVKAVQDYLRKTYPYTTTLTHKRDTEPVDEFLFETRTGHCEYYASAMALLLRYVGVHTRQINGFVAGVWNGYGNYLAVRHGDAHAWVEVLYSNTGWVTVDPTPPGGASPASSGGIAGRMRHMVDALRLRWFRYVVEYDLSKQLSLIKKVSQAFRQKGNATEDFLVRYKNLWKTLTALAVLVLAGLGWRTYGQRLLEFMGRRRVLGQRAHAAVTLYGRLLALMDRAGHSKPPGITPMEFASELAAANQPGADLVLRFTLVYYGVRFGQDELTPERSQELDQLLVAIKEQLRQG